MMDPLTPATVIALFKGAFALAKKRKDAELSAELLELQERMLQLVEEREQLASENRQLRDQRSLAAEFEYRDNAYFRRDDGPYCPRCWDDDRKVIRMQRHPGKVPTCPKCGTYSHPDSSANESGLRIGTLRNDYLSEVD